MPDRDTDIGGRHQRFPDTRHSVVEAVADADPEVRRRALDTLIASYWKPVYKILRLKWRASNEDAKDLTQGFFASLLERPKLERYEPTRAKFRTYLRVCLDSYVADERQAALRLKRGGGVLHLPLDFEAAEGELRQQAVADLADPDDFFQREWLRSLLALVVEELREQCERSGKTIEFTLFRCYDLEGPDAETRPTYADLAREFGVDVTKVTNALHATRRRFREILLGRVRANCGSDVEFREEVAELFGDGA